MLLELRLTLTACYILKEQIQYLQGTSKSKSSPQGAHGKTSNLIGSEWRQDVDGSAETDNYLASVSSDKTRFVWETRTTQYRYEVSRVI